VIKTSVSSACCTEKRREGGGGGEGGEEEEEEEEEKKVELALEISFIFLPRTRTKFKENIIMGTTSTRLYYYPIFRTTDIKFSFVHHPESVPGTYHPPVLTSMHFLLSLSNGHFSKCVTELMVQSIMIPLFPHGLFNDEFVIEPTYRRIVG
jgi:hypothetical protein